MMLNKGELFARLGEILATTDSDVRFSFAGEELEVERIDMEEEMDEAWLILIPKAETEEETGPWFIGRREEDKGYVGKHRIKKAKKGKK